MSPDGTVPCEILGVGGDTTTKMKVMRTRVAASHNARRTTRDFLSGKISE